MDPGQAGRDLERVKHFLWHGNIFRALQILAGLRDGFDSWGASKKRPAYRQIGICLWIGSPVCAGFPGLGRAGGDGDVGAPELAVSQPSQVHRPGARLPVQLAGQRHVAEPGDVEDALLLKPPLDPRLQDAGEKFLVTGPSGHGGIPFCCRCDADGAKKNSQRAGSSPGRWPNAGITPRAASVPMVHSSSASCCRLTCVYTRDLSPLCTYHSKTW